MSTRKTRVFLLPVTVAATLAAQDRYTAAWAGLCIARSGHGAQCACAREAHTPTFGACAAQCDALEHAVEDMCKMYLPAEPAL